ncbi:WecB/TagA/CpsF family glycosyltransferase [Nostoc sp. FACHB-152]|uniref:WecB/TagA/CpsF family glycosyltransferase n=1 Tax=unclassified Nostoc TaxID=2593658 RepID=UPI0016833742|nr:MULTISPECIES: WecB/TagA/CpsF family glycosyltransferase [unclassified Nostoc]MBD2445735.1 WecB/TagA/CpsF family glycosyltransferase [Nostoc sp. FACHB-152]MBD2466849.1 WecB/TagA/CpsF family glycosyltransferase [Nostoc sp. FACHB-145]
MVGKVFLPTQRVLDFPITALRFEDQIQTILKWGMSRQSKTVCVANVHMLMEAHWNPEFANRLQNSDIVTPDGMPLVWMMRHMGVRCQDRVAGMDIFLEVCQHAQTHNISVFFVGSKKEILDKIHTKLKQEFPKLKIAGMEPLPFCPLREIEDKPLINEINSSGAGIVWVSLGCPKQEKWMIKHKGKIQAVMVGVGGVFPVYAGIQKRAPRLVRDLGLEWFYRWMQEPRRLWRRYTTTIPAFIWLATRQLLSNRNSISGVFIHTTGD